MFRPVSFPQSFPVANLRNSISALQMCFLLFSFLDCFLYRPPSQLGFVVNSFARNNLRTHYLSCNPMKHLILL
jgi:hypothetical protein